MKFFVVLSVLFATICMIQANELDLILQTYHDYPLSSQGKIILTLHGDSISRVINFEKYFKNVVCLKEKINFPEEIKKFTFYWYSERYPAIIIEKLEIKVNGAEIPQSYYFYQKMESGTFLTLDAKSV